MAKEKAEKKKIQVAKKVEAAKNKVKAIKSEDNGPDDEDEDDKIVEKLTKKDKQPQDEPNEDAEDIEDVGFGSLSKKLHMLSQKE